MATPSAPLQLAPPILLSIDPSLEETVIKPADRFCLRCADVWKVKKLYIQPQSFDFSRKIGRSGHTGLRTVRSKGATGLSPFHGHPVCSLLHSPHQPVALPQSHDLSGPNGLLILAPQQAPWAGSRFIFVVTPLVRTVIKMLIGRREVNPVP